MLNLQKLPKSAEKKHMNQNIATCLMLFIAQIPLLFSTLSKRNGKQS
jgi:hypothetical protein